MTDLLKFIQEHQYEDVTKLILNRDKWPGLDVELAVNTIVSRRKLKGKMDSWSEHPELIFPISLSAEQCSSEATGVYKANLAEKIAKSSEQIADSENINSESLSKVKSTTLAFKWTIADLTGGLGVDTRYFAQKASKVLYNEMQELLYEATKYNLEKLGVDNLILTNRTLVVAQERSKPGENLETTNFQNELIGAEASVKEILGDFQPTIIYLDPARRGEDGKKVFLLEDCSPDVLGLKDELFQHSRHILLKLSPMADITMLIERLGQKTREVHIVSVDRECKEILLWMDKDFKGNEPLIVASDIKEVRDEQERYKTESNFKFKLSEERTAIPRFTTKEELDPSMQSELGTYLDGAIYLFEPNKSLMKAGAFNLISERLNMSKLARSTHFYLSSEVNCGLLRYGKVLGIQEIHPFNNKTIKLLGEKYPGADLTARNLPITTEQLRKKMGLDAPKSKKNEHEPVDHAHIYVLKVDLIGNLFFVTK